MAQPGPDLVPVRRRFIRARTKSNGVILKRRLARRGFRLNATGKAIWLLCDGQTPVNTICDLLEQRFQNTGMSIRQDIMTTLTELEKFGLLTFRNKPQKGLGAKTIDLREIPFYVINCRSDTVKRDRMQQQLSDLGLRFEMVDAMECEPANVGTAISHLRILNRKTIETPFGVLEDDCVFSENFRYQFTVPTNIDAFYLGMSRFGIEVPGKLSWGKWDDVKWSRYDHYNLRVFNMLARHAVLYLSDTFRQAALDAMIDAVANYEQMFPGDVGIASTHLSHLVLTPLEPICYQASDLGGREGSTDKALPEI